MCGRNSEEEWQETLTTAVMVSWENLVSPHYVHVIIQKATNAKTLESRAVLVYHMHEEQNKIQNTLHKENQL